jgi:predicted nucleic acid-binding protein
MRRAFLDTSYLLALLLRNDEHHSAAVQCQAEYAGELVTTDYVLVEFYDALCQSALRSLAIEAADRLMNDPRVTIVPASRDLFTKGRELFRDRADKDWSLTDCLSFVVMQDQGLQDALTADHHFEQAGFNVLLTYRPGGRLKPAARTGRLCTIAADGRKQFAATPAGS